MVLTSGITELTFFYPSTGQYVRVLPYLFNSLDITLEMRVDYLIICSCTFVKSQVTDEGK